MSVSVTGMEADFTSQITQALTTISSYSLHLLYLLVAIDIALLGILWVIKGSSVAKEGLLRVAYIGFLFTLVLNFSSFLQILINGFIAIGFTVSDAGQAFIFHPDTLWDQSLSSIASLFSIAAQYGYSNVGVSILYTSLGFLIMIATLALVSSILVYALQFYVIALIQLVMLPFGALRITQSLFFGATSQLVAAGARVCVLIFTAGICLTTISSTQSVFTADTPLQEPLLLFAITFVAAFLSWALPAFAGRAVGHLKWGASHSVEVSSSSGAISVGAGQSLSQGPSSMLSSSGPASPVQAASTLSPVSVAVSGSMGSATPQHSATARSPASGAPSAADIESRAVSEKASKRAEKNYKAFDDE